MALNFPTPASPGDIYTANGITYTYDGVKWIGTAQGNAQTDRIVNGDFYVNLQSDGSLVIPAGDHNSELQGQIISRNESSFINLDVQFGTEELGGIRLGTGNATPVDIVTSWGPGTNQWRFGADGNLTLPTNLDFGASPAVQSSGILFGDGTLQTTAYTGDLTQQGSPIALVDNVGQPPDAGTLWYNTDDGRLYVADGTQWADANPQSIPGNMVEYESDDSVDLRGNLTFADGTLQTTAYPGPQSVVGANVVIVGESAEGGEGALFYNTTDGRLYVDVSINGTTTWLDASPAVIPSNMVEYESNDSVELRGNLVFLDTTEQTTAFNLHPGITAPPAGIWYNTDDGRLYSKIGNTWVDTNPAVISENAVTFTNGNIVLPDDGYVTWANGTNILSGISSTADTGSITFSGVKITGDGDILNSGSIELVPNDSLYNNGQWVNIYPTNQFDYPHVHITAGMGGELYIGNDYQYVKTATDGSIGISSYNGSTHQWVFGADGTLTTDGTININGEGKGLIVDAAGDKRFGFMKYYGIEGALTHNSAVPIRIGRTVETDITQASQSSFTTEMYIATDGKIGIANVTPAHRLSVSGDIYTSSNIVFADGTRQVTAAVNNIYSNSNVASYLITNPQSGTYSNSNVASYLVANPEPGTYSNTNVASYLSSGSLETAWVHGNLTVGNLTVTGNSTIINTESYVVTDNIIQMANANPADTLDIGFVGHRTVGNTLQHTGLVRDASAGSWKLFSNVTTQPGNTVDFTNAILDNLELGTVTGADFKFANGVTILSTVAASSTYSNSNVASYIGATTFSSISTSLITGVGQINGTAVYIQTNGSNNFYFDSTGNLVLPSSGAINYANGQSILSGITGTYSNTNVIANLQNLTTNVTTTANITAANIVTSGATSGNISGANYISANVFQVSSGIFWANGTAWSSTSGGTTYSNANVASYLTAGNISIGTAGFTVLPNIVAQFTSNVNSYGQINMQNISSGTASTTEIVATANNGTDTVFFVDMGIAGNTYNNLSPNNSLGTIIYANDAYLYAQGNTSATVGGNLAIGAATTGRSVTIFAGGINNSSNVATFANTGVTVYGNITTSGTYGNITGANVISANTVTVTTVVRTVPVTFANLPTASAAGAGARAFITDGNTTTFASAVTGSGANSVPVYSNGTNWFVG